MAVTPFFFLAQHFLADNGPKAEVEGVQVRAETSAFRPWCVQIGSEIMMSHFTFDR